MSTFGDSLISPGSTFEIAVFFIFTLNHLISKSFSDSSRNVVTNYCLVQVCRSKTFFLCPPDKLHRSKVLIVPP